MNLVINGEKIVLDRQDLCLSELLVLRDVESPDMVSVQINGEFINKEEYSESIIGDNDEIDFLYFMGGGR